MKNKISTKEIIDKILYILEWEGREMSIREIKTILEEKHEIKKSPQVIKKLLLHLKNKGRIE